MDQQLLITPPLAQCVWPSRSPIFHPSQLPLTCLVQQSEHLCVSETGDVENNQSSHPQRKTHIMHQQSMFSPCRLNDLAYLGCLIGRPNSGYSLFPNTIDSTNLSTVRKFSRWCWDGHLIFRNFTALRTEIIVQALLPMFSTKICAECFVLLHYTLIIGLSDNCMWKDGLSCVEISVMLCHTQEKSLSVRNTHFSPLGNRGTWLDIMIF